MDTVMKFGQENREHDTRDNPPYSGPLIVSIVTEESSFVYDADSSYVRHSHI